MLRPPQRPTLFPYTTLFRSLVSVDLLDQAADLLQHQIDHRLQGAARSQVAARLAVVYLMNRKADRALAALQNTQDRKSTRLNSSHVETSYAVFCLKKKI